MSITDIYRANRDRLLALRTDYDRARAEFQKSILRYAREHLAPCQRVRRIEFFELPKTISGKIRRVELRARENELADIDRASRTEWRDDDFPDLAAQTDVSGTVSSGTPAVSASQTEAPARRPAESVEAGGQQGRRWWPFGRRG